MPPPAGRGRSRGRSRGRGVNPGAGAPTASAGPRPGAPGGDAPPRPMAPGQAAWGPGAAPPAAPGPAGAAPAPAWGQRPPGPTPPQPPQQQPMPAAPMVAAPAAAAAAPVAHEGRSQARGGGAQGMGEVTGRMRTMELGARGRPRRPVNEMMATEVVKTIDPAIKDNDKYGFTGRQVEVMSNYYRVNPPPDDPNEQIYQYHVHYAPEVLSPGVRRALLFMRSDIIGEVRSFDGTQLYIPKKLCEVKQSIELQAMRSDGTVVQLTLTNACPVFIASDSGLHLMNVIFRQLLKAVGYGLIRRNYFNPKLSVRVPNQGIDVWPGFETSILLYKDNNVFLKLDVIHKMLSSITCLDVMCRNADQGRSMDYTRTELLGQIVLTKYNNKTYRIDDLDESSNPTHTFEAAGGQSISYMEYYQKNYNLTIRDERQPLLVSRTKATRGPGGKEIPARNLFLIPEFCYLTGLPDKMRTDHRVMKEIGQHTRLVPHERVRRYQAFRHSLDNMEDSKKILSDWKLGFSKEPEVIKARVLPKTEVFMRSGRNGQIESLQYDQLKSDWTFKMRNTRVFVPVDCTRWMIVYMQRDQQRINSFLQGLREVCPPLKIGLSPEPQRVALANDRGPITGGLFVRAIRHELSQGANPEIICVVVPSNASDMYNAIKKELCVERAILSQVVTAKTLGRQPHQLKSIYTKIAIQMCCKLGGAPWTVNMPMSNVDNKKGVMICGFDVYHDASIKKGYSCGALVSTTDKHATGWFSQPLFQEGELSDHLAPLIVAAVKRWGQINGMPPSFIVIYRDGVGDGQVKMVFQYEMPQIQKGLDDLWKQKNCEPINWSLIVVKKRVMARFFGGSRQNLENPMPGTIVDRSATRPEWLDFFLVSQSVNQGTVTPTHYHIMKHGQKTVDMLQCLTYKMTHLYWNWMGTVRVPAPCQYAHKVAQLVGMNLKTEPNPRLDRTLWYL